MARKTVVFRSDDDGESWTEAGRISGLFRFPEHPQSLFQARDGALLMLTNGIPFPAGDGWPTRRPRDISVLLRSADGGANWSLLSVLGHKDFDIEEGSAAYLPDGSIGTPSRPTSAWFQSHDDGKTWSAPRQLHEGQGTAGKALYKKGHLLVTPDGVTVLVFSGGPGGSGQVIYSRDSGRTWVRPAADRGFVYAPLGYYPSACALDDGSIFAVGDHQGFKNKYGPYGAEVTGMRFRIRSPEEGDGIELLPIGGGRWAAGHPAAAFNHQDNCFRTGVRGRLGGEGLAAPALTGTERIRRERCGFRVRRQTPAVPGAARPPLPGPASRRSANPSTDRRGRS